MTRHDWEKLKANKGEKSPITLQEAKLLPFNPFLFDTVFVGGEMVRVGDIYTIRIYRHDPKDKKDEMINVDEYQVMEYMDNHYDFPEIVKRASTDNDETLQSYLTKYVYLLKLRDDEILDHHRPDVPEYLSIQLE